jgi:serralysin
VPRSTVWLARAVVGAMTVTLLTGVTAAGSHAPAGSHAGPPYHFVTELMGQFKTIPLKDQGMLTTTPHGYRFRTGQQDSHLVITRVNAGLRLVDTGTKRFKKLTPACTRQKVRRGIAAVCRVPAATSVRRPLLVEVWPRLGNDVTDASTLSARFAVTVLADGGNDVARFGSGRDFFNGHSGRDVVWGGVGNDWIRAGLGDDVVQGGPGNDYIVGMEGRDAIRAGDGNDRAGGGDGSDRLWGDAGADFLLCGTGRDATTAGARDRVFHDCESVHRG